MDSNATDFAAWITHLRTQRGLAPHQLAEHIGCTEVLVQQFERAVQRPARDMAERLADALQVPANERDQFMRLAGAHDTEQQAPDLAQLHANRDPRSRPHMQPLPTNPLIGRDTERVELVRHLHAPNHHLITLVGPGGIGKTSLALHVAAALAATADPICADGVAVVWLAGVQRANDVALAIADTLDLPLQGARPAVEQLIDALSDRVMLLVIDNVEHLLGPDGSAVSELIGRMLADASTVRLLVTSRERLRLRDEWVIELGGLAVPTVDRGPQVDQADAVRLFADRARQVAPSFTLTGHNRAAVAHICRRLEGMPLALELAATWARALSPAEIAVELDRSLDLLTLTTRDMPARHRSMRSVLDHSWNLLDDTERCALARLSVFRGGCDREAAHAITGATWPTLTILLDKSLLRVDFIAGETRYRLHELVRHYAAERLASDPAEQHATEERHASYYAAVIERTINLRTGASTPDGRALLDRNIDNVRAAWTQALTARNAATLAMLTRAFWILYDDHGWLHDAVPLFGRAADALRDVDGPAAVRGHLLGLQSYFLTRIARYREARSVSEEALALLQANDVTDGYASVLFYRGVSLCHVGLITEASAQFTQAAALARATNDRFLQSWSGIWLAIIANFRGDYQTAERYTTEFLAAFRGQGYSRGEAVGLAALGELARCYGRFDDATHYLREGLRIGSGGYDTLAITTCMCQLGAVALHRSELDEARYLLRESAAIARELGDPWHVGRALSFLVRVELARGKAEAAHAAYEELARIALDGEAMLVGDAIYGSALLFHAWERHAEAWASLDRLQAVAMKAELKPEVARLTAKLERLLNPMHRAAAIEAGRDCALGPWLSDVALRAARPSPMSAAEPNGVPTGGFHVAATGETVSPREVDVLRLIADGANNAEIAQQLVISLHTVKTHVAHILAKLNVPSRRAAALQARHLGVI